MSTPTRSAPMRVVLAGGGFAALEAAVALRMSLMERVRVHLVTRSPTLVYRPEEVGEPFGAGAPRQIRLTELADELDFELHAADVASVDAERHAVQLDRGEPIDYDALLVAVGAHPYPAFDAGVLFDRRAVPEDSDLLVDDLREGFAGHVAVVLPSEVPWTLPAYELALRLTTVPHCRQVTLITHEPRAVAAFGTTCSHAVKEVLDGAGVELVPGVDADVVGDTALRIGGSWRQFDRIVHLPRRHGPRLAGLPADEHGFIPVDAFCRVPGAPGVWAAGDATTQPIKQGGLAAQMADAAVAAMGAGAGLAMEPFTAPSVLRGRLPTPAGTLHLLAHLADAEGTSRASYEPMWSPPTKVASRWLAPWLAARDAGRRTASG